MADKAISELIAATQVTASDLFVLQQAGAAKKLSGQILENWLVALADGHGGIQTIEKTDTEGLVDTYTITLADETTLTFTVTNAKSITNITDVTSGTQGDGRLHTITITFNDGTTKVLTMNDGDKGDTGAAWYMHIKYSAVQPTSDSDMGDDPDNYIGIYSGTSATAPTHYTSYTWFKYKGETGDTGNGIASVTKTGTSGLVDTYTVTFTNGNTTTFNVTNGSSIQSISKTSTSGLVDTYTVTLTNGTTTTFTVTNAKSISSITQTGGSHAAGTFDTYTITFNDGDTAQFQVYNGTNGTGSVSTVDGIDSTNQDVELLLWDNGAPTTETVGKLKQRYFDLNDGRIYICTAIDTSTTPATYTWTGSGVLVDSSMSSTSENPVQNKVIYTALSAKENTSNKVTSMSASSTDTQYPSAKAVYDELASQSSQIASKADKTAITNPNLLYNPFPWQINQRGITTPTSGQYWMDRWKLDGANGYCTVGDDFMEIVGNGANSNGIYQPLEDSLLNFIAGKTLTASVLLYDGTVYSGTAVFTKGTRSAFLDTLGKPRMFISAAGNFNCAVQSETAAYKIRAVKLELGSVSTLANDTQPNYTAELLKCQRFFYRINLVNGISLGAGLGVSTGIRFGMKFPTRMRLSTPTMTCSDFSVIKAYWGDGTTERDITGITRNSYFDDAEFCGISFSCPQASTGLIAALRVKGTTYIDFDAEL